LSGLFRRTNTIMEKTKFYCESCDFYANKLCRWNDHILTKKHSNKSQQKFPPDEFYCEKCDVRCCHLSVFNRHKKTKKHIKTPEGAKISAQSSTVEILLKENNELRNFIIEQSKTNSELLSKALESQKPLVVNNNNQKFNINVFLNETCKDAMNLSDFINNIQISYEDLENNARLGFVNGISKIFLDNLNQLDISKRPIHCTDVKRETMYIRDDNMWKKQTDDQTLQKAIQAVSYRSMGKLAKWKQENPDYMDADSEFSQRCLIMQKNTLAGSERGVYYPKVIHVLARESAIEK
jgi:hypothetical protein